MPLSSWALRWMISDAGSKRLQVVGELERDRASAKNEDRVRNLRQVQGIVTGDEASSLVKTRDFGSADYRNRLK